MKTITTHPTTLNGKTVRVTVPENEYTMESVVPSNEFTIFHSGGNIMLAARTRDDGRYVVLGSDLVCVYENEAAFENGEDALQVIELF